MRANIVQWRKFQIHFLHEHQVMVLQNHESGRPLFAHPITYGTLVSSTDLAYKILKVIVDYSCKKYQSVKQPIG